MPGSNEEYVQFALDDDLSADFHEGRTWLDGTEITIQEAADIRALWMYRQQQIERRFSRQARHKAQCKALKLMRRYLSVQQLRDMRRRGEFLLALPSGNTYRVDARRGKTEQVLKHGRRWFVRRRFCIHEPDDVKLRMPPADLALTHLFLLLADEQEFLEVANATDPGDMQWNGEWRRQLREARLRREAGSTE